MCYLDKYNGLTPCCNASAIQQYGSICYCSKCGYIVCMACENEEEGKNEQN